MSSALRDRLMELIDRLTIESRRFRQLDEWTRCPADSWRKFYVGRQRCTEEMLEGLCRNFPSLSMWIVTGKHDYANQQYDPAGYIAIDKTSLSTIFEKDPAQITEEEYLRLEIELARQQMIYEEGKSGLSVSKIIETMEMRERKMSRNDMLNEKLDEQEKILRHEHMKARLRRAQNGEVITNVPHVINLRDPYSAPSFEWGYHGTGPKELAANILHWHGCTIEQAKMLATDFSQDIISSLQHNEAELSESETQNWLSMKGYKILEKYSKNEH